MSFQKCPICDGAGHVGIGFPTGTPCTVCHGQKIIDSITGLPPQIITYVTSTGSIRLPDPDKKDETWLLL